jgi:hypothetical protein
VEKVVLLIDGQITFHPDDTVQNEINQDIDVIEFQTGVDFLVEFKHLRERLLTEPNIFEIIQ